MNIRHEFPRPEAIPVSIDHHSPLLLLGSCFSEHIANELRKSGFSVLSNPFGVVFHPVPLARFIRESIEGTVTERIVQREDVFLSMDASSAVYSLSEAGLRSELAAIREEFRRTLMTARTLIVTFGSAHGYRLKTREEEIVANCHKIPQSSFHKALTPSEELLAEWTRTLELLNAFNPDLEVVFTVSPVRYSRDGWVENNRSKARLLLLTEALQQACGVHYFPAYEIVNDLLRDYRYFEQDGVHPNGLATKQVWEVFADWYFDERTRQLVSEVQTLRRMESHRLLFPESAASAKFLENFHEKRESFLSLHPFIVW